MQVCTSLQTDNHASTPTTQLFTGRMPFLPPKRQRQSTEGQSCHYLSDTKINSKAKIITVDNYTWLFNGQRNRSRHLSLGE